MALLPQVRLPCFRSAATSGTLRLPPAWLPGCAEPYACAAGSGALGGGCLAAALLACRGRELLAASCRNLGAVERTRVAC